MAAPQPDYVVRINREIKNAITRISETIDDMHDNIMEIVQSEIVTQKKNVVNVTKTFFQQKLSSCIEMIPTTLMDDLPLMSPVPKTSTNTGVGQVASNIVDTSSSSTSSGQLKSMPATTVNAATSPMTPVFVDPQEPVATPEVDNHSSESIMESDLQSLVSKTNANTGIGQVASNIMDTFSSSTSSGQLKSMPATTANAATSPMTPVFVDPQEPVAAPEVDNHSSESIMESDLQSLVSKTNANTGVGQVASNIMDTSSSSTSSGQLKSMHATTANASTSPITPVFVDPQEPVAAPEVANHFSESIMESDLQNSFNAGMQANSIPETNSSISNNQSATAFSLSSPKEHSSIAFSPVLVNASTLPISHLRDNQSEVANQSQSVTSQAIIQQINSGANESAGIANKKSTPSSNDSSSESDEEDEESGKNSHQRNSGQSNDSEQSDSDDSDSDDSNSDDNDSDDSNSDDNDSDDSNSDDNDSDDSNSDDTDSDDSNSKDTDSDDNNSKDNDSNDSNPNDNDSNDNNSKDNDSNDSNSNDHDTKQSESDKSSRNVQSGSRTVSLNKEMKSRQETQKDGTWNGLQTGGTSSACASKQTSPRNGQKDHSKTSKRTSEEAEDQNVAENIGTPAKKVRFDETCVAGHHKFSTEANSLANQSAADQSSLQCEKCNENFYTDCAFKLHQGIHKKSYYCTYPKCGYYNGGFGTNHKGNLVVHIRTKHFELPTTQKEQKRLGIIDNRDPNAYAQKGKTKLKKKMIQKRKLSKQTAIAQPTTEVPASIRETLQTIESVNDASMNSVQVVNQEEVGGDSVPMSLVESQQAKENVSSDPPSLNHSASTIDVSENCHDSNSRNKIPILKLKIRREVDSLSALVSQPEPLPKSSTKLTTSKTSSEDQKKKTINHSHSSKSDPKRDSERDLYRDNKKRDQEKVGDRERHRSRDRSRDRAKAKDNRSSSKDIMDDEIWSVHPYVKTLSLACYNGCCKELTSRKSYDEHMKNAHNMRPIICPLLGCTATVSSVNSWLHHGNAFHFTNKDQLQCRACSYVAIHPLSLFGHFSQNHMRGIFKCCECSFQGRVPKAVLDHYEAQHGAAGSGPATTPLKHTENQVHPCGMYRVCSVKCEVAECDRRFNSNNDEGYLKHLADSHRLMPYRCVMLQCKMSFEKKSQLNSHLDHDHSNQEFRCGMCHHVSIYKSYNELFHHTEVHHQKGRFECNSPNCDYWANTQIEMVKHYSLANHPMPIFSKFITLTRNCTEHSCPTKWSSDDDLVDHLRMAHNKFKFICKHEKCDKSFATNGQLKDHLNSQHDHERDWKCHFCGIPKQNHKSLATHIWMYHMSGQFKCTSTGCDFVATHRIEAMEHFNTKHPYEFHTMWPNKAAANHRPIPPPPAALAPSSFNKCSANPQTIQVPQAPPSNSPCDGVQMQTKPSLATMPSAILDSSITRKYVINYIYCMVDNCKMWSTSTEQFDQHLKGSHNMDPIICPSSNCTLTFVDMRQLAAHIAQMHMKESWNCRNPQCNSEIVYTPQKFAQMVEHQILNHVKGCFSCSIKSCHFKAENRAEVVKHYDCFH